jgi:hypothetical protein
MIKNLKNNSSGEISTRDLIIAGIITLIGALIIIVVFIVISRSKDTTPDYSTQQLIDQIKQQGLEEAQKRQKEEDAIEEDDFDPFATIAGTLSNHEQGIRITIVTSAGEQEILLSSSTIITHNGEEKQESDLTIGDTLSVEIEKEKNGKQTALEITILRSTSPSIPQNVSVPTLQPPPVETRPVSPF